MFRARSLLLLATILLTLALACQSIASVIYVKSDSTGTPSDGKSWSTAYHSILTGLAAARMGDEIWVAEGIYKANPLVIKQRVALYGGFNGTETSRDQRDFNANQTILDGQMTQHTVFVPVGLNASSLLDGFVITNGIGRIDIYGDYYGGGIYCLGSATIRNNYITGNAATFGGGIYVGSNGTPVIDNNTITANGAYEGGAIFSDQQAAPTIADNWLTYNSAIGGGALYLDTCSSVISNNIVALNDATTEGGGGIYAFHGNPFIVNNTIVGDSCYSGTDGGGILSDIATPTIANNIIAFCTSGIFSSSSALPIMDANDVYSNTDYNYSAAVPHATDLSVDPSFVNYLAGDYHILPNSQLVDAGNDADVDPNWPDIDGQNRINGRHVDIGADEAFTSDPVITPDSGIFSAPVDVSISCETPGAVIRYTMDGTVPSRTHGAIYGGPFSVYFQQVQAISYADGFNDSPIASTSFSWQLPDPVFTPAGGSYGANQSVAISCSVGGAAIHYTTDGSMPDASSPVYSSPISVTQATTINAITVKTGWVDSNVASAVYTLKLPDVTFSPVAGTYTSPQAVTINGSIAGAVIHFTTDGSTPTEASPTYSTAINVSATTTIKAFAVKSGWIAGNLSTAVYNISLQSLPTPTFTPAAGSYSAPQSVAINSSVSGATIYYTTNGSTPTHSSSVYSTPISVSSSMTIKALASKTGWTDSSVASAAYTISANLPKLISLSPTSGTFNSDGTVYTIAAKYADDSGYSALRDCLLLINTAPTTANAIYLRYNEGTRKLYIRDDADSTWLGGYSLGANSTMSNSQVSVSVLNTKVLKTPSTITVQWSLSIKPTMAGKTCPVYLYVNDLNGSFIGWTQFGTYTIR